MAVGKRQVTSDTVAIHGVSPQPQSSLTELQSVVSPGETRVWISWSSQICIGVHTAPAKQVLRLACWLPSFYVSFELVLLMVLTGLSFEGKERPAFCLWLWAEKTVEPHTGRSAPRGSSSPKPHRYPIDHSSDSLPSLQIRMCIGPEKERKENTVWGRNPLRQISFSISCIMPYMELVQRKHWWVFPFFTVFTFYLITDDVNILSCKHLYVNIKASSVQGIIWSRETWGKGGTFPATPQPSKWDLLTWRAFLVAAHVLSLSSLGTRRTMTVRC